MQKCIFCKIVSGEEPCYKVWEDEDHLAFLTIYPNTEGASVVIPKRHYPSDFMRLPRDVRHALTDAACAVGDMLTSAFEDVGRTGMVAEGYGVDHVHLKLFPLHGTAADEWQQRLSDIYDYFETYRGYISSHSSHRADDDQLRRTLERIQRSRVE